MVSPKCAGAHEERCSHCVVPPLCTGAYKKSPCCVASPKPTGAQKGCVPNPTLMDLCYFRGSCRVTARTEKCWMQIGFRTPRYKTLNLDLNRVNFEALPSKDVFTVASPQCTDAYKKRLSHCVASPQCTSAYKESYSLFDFSAMHQCIQGKVLPLCGCSTIQQCK